MYPYALRAIRACRRKRNLQEKISGTKSRVRCSVAILPAERATGHYGVGVYESRLSKICPSFLFDCPSPHARGRRQCTWSNGRPADFARMRSSRNKKEDRSSSSGRLCRTKWGRAAHPLTISHRNKRAKKRMCTGATVTWKLPLFGALFRTL